jgi:uncharacterized protein YdeI (YjbR/CyaY-like superfamily)
VEPRFFKNAESFRRWLAKHHRTRSELVVGFYKKHTGKPSIDWEGSVGQALCFGWIDGVRRRIDEESYQIRFTPRRPGSIWSEKNVRRFVELEREGAVHEAGRAAFAAWDAKRPQQCSYERPAGVLGAPYERTFRAHAHAWTFFEEQAPSYRRAVSAWVMSARREPTRERRLARAIEESEAGRRVDLLAPNRPRRSSRTV